jgi:hypothetical protein
MPMEKAARGSVRYLRRDTGGNAPTNVARTSGADGDSGFPGADLHSIVECLFAAHYSEPEILDYLTGPLGCGDAEAAAVLLATRR